MAEKKEPGFWQTIKKGALIGIAALGLTEAAWLLLPSAAFALLATTLVNGAFWGAMGALGYLGYKGIEKIAKPPEPTKA